ncbi:beta-lactamase hydrolase domain-containing protein [Calothrix sp. UHCC 0171]|uniref:beta-lactamase hydrolase domain-containing protein n=1 Tax=Calothrix sp. UHCC 0171 TaxID=3110245 RepID=UPI002B220CB5|nr:sulfur transferase domain-containing protein [Calothrix sp. UHCC 0171]MEA5573078.1 sulfur transferase domain-containing protein [Calothrix sp. UHCC 0171]
MSNRKKISNNLSATGQVTAEQLQQAAAEGFKSVLNLRSPDEPGFIANEQQQAANVGLEYANIPLKPSEANQKVIEAAIKQIENLPQPVLIHCAAGARASGIGLIASAIQEGFTAEEITQKATEIGISLEQPHLKQFLLEKFGI